MAATLTPTVKRGPWPARLIAVALHFSSPLYGCRLLLRRRPLHQDGVPEATEVQRGLALMLLAYVYELAWALAGRSFLFGWPLRNIVRHHGVGSVGFSVALAAFCSDAPPYAFTRNYGRLVFLGMLHTVNEAYAGLMTLLHPKKDPSAYFAVVQAVCEHE